MEMWRTETIGEGPDRSSRF